MGTMKKKEKELEVRYSDIEYGKKLGESGLGATYEGFWNSKHIAIKVVAKRLVALSKLEPSEIVRLGSLKHDNVVQFYGTSLQDQTFCFLTEFAPNGSVHDYIHVKGHNPEVKESIRWAEQIAEVLLTEELDAKICGFGFAKFLEYAAIEELADSYRWMAPEIMRHEPATFYSDVFSYGMLLWELLSHKQPFAELPTAEVCNEVLHRKRPPIPRTTSFTTHYLYKLMQMCWKADNKARPSFTKILAALKNKDNSSSEESSATAEKKEETEESDDEEIDSKVESLLEKYCHQPKIKHKSLKCLFTGPPRVGKTTFKNRLLRVIKNLITSGILSPSGGLEKPISVVVGETKGCVTVIMESDTDWKPQHSLLDEAQTVLEFIDKSHHQSPPTPAPPKPIPPTSVSARAMPALTTPVATTAVPSISGPDLPTPKEPEGDTLDNIKKLMREVLSSRKLHSIKDIEKTTTLYFMDTGGQPEFHEIMPLILSGPALHMIFFNLTFDLDDPIPIQFCHQDGSDNTITYVSSYTGKQMIFQLLSSLYYFSKSLSPDSEPAAVLIGTHLDLLKEQDEVKINDALNRLLSNVEFHDQGFLTYPTRDKSTIFTPVNNYSGDEDEIHKLQVFLREVIDNRFSAVELPSSWLFFHLLLRHHYENSPGVCTLLECQELAKGCHLDRKDVPQVLRYIHRYLGTILFYEEVPGLNELVICDPNMLFERIYHLVAVSFGGNRSHHTSAAEVRRTGEIPSKVLEHISSQPSSSLLTNGHIIELLKHFKILTEFVSDDRITYFMPCLLHPNNSLELSCDALHALWPPPLLVRFNGNYIPIGVFSALVVKLSESSWEPDRDTRYRNHILFLTDGVFPVELIVHPAYLDFRVRITNYKEEPKEIHEFCMEVRKRVVDTLKSILGLHQHTKKAKFQLGFYCPGSIQADGQPHFCGCLPRQNLINPKAFVCSKSPQCQEQCRLPHECTIWFEYWKDNESDRHRDQVNISVGNTSRTAGVVAAPRTGQLHLQPPPTPASTTADELGALAASAGSTTANMFSMKPTLNQLTRMKTTTGEKIKIIESVAPQWKRLGDLLDFDPEGRTLELIEANNQLKGVVACCREMFVTWLKGNGREATWEVLIELFDDSDQSELAKKIKTALL